MENNDKLFIRDLSVRTKRGYLCVRVMRKWNYDGNVPGGPVFYIGLLFADEQGSAIYAQIPQSEIERLGSQLDLDNVYTICRFSVRTSKIGYVPFDDGIMIQITSFTTITPSKVPIDKFPNILYRITPFNQITASGQAAMKYIDVLGIITKEDLPKTACPKGKEHVSTLKEITITDLSGAELTVTLWEDHVDKFQIKNLVAADSAHSMVALFCGCLPKKIFNKTQVNAGNACRWYINPDIPEAQPFYDRLKTNPVAIQCVLPVGSTSQPIVRPRVLEHKTVAEMNAINPYDFPEQGCKCTVKITQVPADQEWWYMGCELCKRRLRNNGGTYYCTKCNCSTAIPLYKLTFVGADETAEARFFCYDVNARQIVRRNCDSLLRAVHNISSLPDQIIRAVGRTYTLSVGLTEQSFNSMATRSYLVDSCVFKPVSETAVSSSSLILQNPMQSTISALHDVPSASHRGRENLLDAGSQTVVTSHEQHQVVHLETQQDPARSVQQTPPPNIDVEETSVKQPADINAGGSKDAHAQSHNVRKRLFDDSPTPSESGADEDTAAAQKPGGSIKKKKASSAAGDAGNRSSSLRKD